MLLEYTVKVVQNKYADGLRIWGRMVWPQFSGRFSNYSTFLRVTPSVNLTGNSPRKQKIYYKVMIIAYFVNEIEQ